MTAEFRFMLSLYAQGVHGVEAVTLPKISLPRLLEISNQQQLLPIVIDTLTDSYDLQKLQIESEYWDSIKKSLRYNTLFYVQRLHFIHRIIQKLENEGIVCCLLKGVAVGKYYPQPFHRFSGDTDILIAPEFEKKAVKILEENGFQCEKRREEAHHTCCWHELGGSIELHHQLYDEVFDRAWFDNQLELAEEFINIQTHVGNVTTLGINDGLLFLVFHLIKHFLLNGINIRMISDVLLYIENNSDNIDWDRYSRILEHLKYKKFMDHIMGIGVAYMGFSADSFCAFEAEDSKIKRLLDDIEAGGTFGKNEKERDFFCHIYNEKRFDRFMKTDYTSFIKKYNHMQLFQRIFPRYEYMQQRYSYIKSFPCLLPLAWGQRLSGAIINVLMHKKSLKDFATVIPKDDSSLLQRRMELVQELDMV